MIAGICILGFLCIGFSIYFIVKYIDDNILSWLDKENEDDEYTNNYQNTPTNRRLQEERGMSITDIEAKTILERDLSCLKQNKALPDSIEFMEIAINALEKQIAKKPKKTESEGFRYTDTYRCPLCGGNFSGTGIADYCYHCGQKLDWSDEE